MFPFYTRNIVTFEPFVFDAFEMLRQRIGFKRTQTNKTKRSHIHKERRVEEERERDAQCDRIVVHLSQLGLVLMFIPLRTTIRRIQN